MDKYGINVTYKTEDSVWEKIFRKLWKLDDTPYIILVSEKLYVHLTQSVLRSSFWTTLCWNLEKPQHANYFLLLLPGGNAERRKVMEIVKLVLSTLYPLEF
jgi:hypothetical protein